MANPDTRLLEALAVTAELTGTRLSDAAAAVMAADLATYPVEQVLGALQKCRRELKGRLTVAAVLERLDDGRPGPEEAWALIPIGPDRRPDEDGSTVWTDEIAEAYGVALPLLKMGDVIAARLAFREVYQRRVDLARDARRPVRWFPSLGVDPRGRESAVDDAIRKGRLESSVRGLLLPKPMTDSAVGLLANAGAKLAAEDVQKLRALLQVKRRRAAPVRSLRLVEKPE